MARATRSGAAMAVDWGSLGPLRIRSKLVAEGVYAGSHKSARRGAGIEFGGHRAYVPGDDLRWIDRRSLLRHDRLLVRQFETETERAVRLVVDASASMAYRGSRAPGSKLAMAALVSTVLARIAIASGDPVGLAYIAGKEARAVPVGGGREGFERILGSLEEVKCAGDSRRDPSLLDRSLAVLSRAARRGSVVVVASDLIDLPPEAATLVSSLALRGRSVVVLQVLDPDEIDLPFEGTVRLRALEGDLVVETDVETTRERYLEAMRALQQSWRDELLARGGALVSASTADDPVAVVRRVIEAVR